MMASTTVFVLEPGVTALGDDHGDRVDQDGGVVDDGSSLSGFGNLKVKISSPKFASSLLSHLTSYSDRAQGPAMCFHHSWKKACAIPQTEIWSQN